MNTSALTGTRRAARHSPELRFDISAAQRFLREAARIGLGAVVSMTLLSGAGWMVSADGAAVYLQALTWGSGFIYLALAIDADDSVIGHLLVTGVSQFAFALAAALATPEFLILATALNAAWLVAWICRM